MDSPKYNTGLFLFILSIPIIYFLTIDRTNTTTLMTSPQVKSSSITKNIENNKSVKKETRDSSTQTSIINYNTIHLEKQKEVNEKLQTQNTSPSNNNLNMQLEQAEYKDKPSDEFCSIENIQLQQGESETTMPDNKSNPSKRILDYFAYIVSGK